MHTIKRPKRKTRDYKPHRHKNVRLNLFQEFIVYLIYIRRAFDTDILAKKFLGSTSKASVKCVRSVLCTWIAAIDKILGAEEWWVKPEHRNRTVSKAFRDCPQVLCIGDCTCVFCGSGRTSELINQQLHSAYYGHTCAKYCVVCSPIGGTVCISPGVGGPAGDHRVMEAAGLFEGDKWQVPKANLGCKCCGMLASEDPQGLRACWQVVIYRPRGSSATAQRTH